MIGTGNAFAKNFYNNNALIEYNSYRLLIDCGITLPCALYNYGLSFNKLDAVLISHIHSDHVGGLEILALKMMFEYRLKPTLYIAESLVEPLWNNSLKGGLLQGNLNQLDDFFNVIPLKTNLNYTLTEGLQVKLIQTNHISGKDSYSFVVNDSFFYSADMVFDADLIHQLVGQGINTIYHDCQLESPGLVHASLEELLTLPANIQQKISLMHYGDNIGNYIGKTGAMQIVKQGVKSKLK